MYNLFTIFIHSVTQLADLFSPGSEQKKCVLMAVAQDHSLALSVQLSVSVSPCQW